jgi:hypothetical protein
VALESVVRDADIGKCRTHACFDYDFVFADHDVVDEILQIGTCSCPVTAEERSA